MLNQKKRQYYLDCIEIEKEVKDSLGKINEWETNQKNAWKLAK